MPKTDKVTAVRKRLNREHRALKSWRAVAEKYDVNVAYVYDLAVNGKEPSSKEVRYRLGLEQRPKPQWLKDAVRFLQERERLTERTGKQ